MDKRLGKKINYWILVFLTVSVVILSYYRIKQETAFKEAGSRFTGEDAIWLLQHSNIELKDKDIEGISTPFRDYIRQ